MSKTIFLYGPQTSGKTTRLLNLIKRDDGQDILMSAEDKARVTNGHEVCDVTLRIPQEWTLQNLNAFKNKIIQQRPVTHVLIDGVQFWTKVQILKVVKIFNQLLPRTPIVLTGCRYYVATPHQDSNEIPISHFLINWCDEAIPVKRTCDFCQRIATHLMVNGYQKLSDHKIAAKDPHLVCDYHFQILNHKNF